MGHPDCFGQDDEKKQKQIPFGDDKQERLLQRQEQIQKQIPFGDNKQEKLLHLRGKQERLLHLSGGADGFGEDAACAG